MNDMALDDKWSFPLRILEGLLLFVYIRAVASLLGGMPVSAHGIPVLVLWAVVPVAGLDFMFRQQEPECARGISRPFVRRAVEVSTGVFLGLAAHYLFMAVGEGGPLEFFLNTFLFLCVSVGVVAGWYIQLESEETKLTKLKAEAVDDLIRILPEIKGYNQKDNDAFPDTFPDETKRTAQNEHMAVLSQAEWRRQHLPMNVNEATDAEQKLKLFVRKHPYLQMQWHFSEKLEVLTLYLDHTFMIRYC